MQTRRTFLAASAAGLAAAATGSHGMQYHLSCGAIGVKAAVPQAIEYAIKFGFDSVDADGKYLATLSDSDLQRLRDDMKSKKIVWAIAGLPVDFRKDDATFQKSFESFPDYAGGLHRAGVERVTTWITPTSGDTTYLQNFSTHSKRLRDCARVLADHGIRFGLEYVGSKTSWASQRYPFVHDMRTMKELIAEIGVSNVGFVLDSWHWYTSNESKKDLLTFSARNVVSVDLNDAPAGIPVDQQIDSKRELPAATGVIDVKAFLGALKEIGFDGPVRAEPFNQPLREMAPDQALAATKAALDKAFSQVG